MRYNFVDIGTSIFQTSLDTANNNTIGLLIEPVKEYYDALPTPFPGIKKGNFAISNYNGLGTMKIPYSDDMNVEYESKENSRHIRKRPFGVSTLDFDRTFKRNHKIKEQKCEVITFKKMCEIYNITEIDYLKIDVEGSEHLLMPQIVEMLDANLLIIHKQLRVEAERFFGEASFKIIDETTNYIANKYGFVKTYKERYQGYNNDFFLDKITSD
jgi:FkbM family methyltransferase